MEPEFLWFLQFLNRVHSSFLIIISLIFIFFSFSHIFSFLKTKLWCNCEICRAYLTSSWSKDFDNLCDWYSYLLKNSPTKTIHIHALRNTVTANPENVEYILKARFENYPKEFAQSFDLASNLSAKRAMTVSPFVWKIKKILNLGSEKQLNRAINVINVLAEDVIRQKRKIGFFNQRDLLARFMRNVKDEKYLRDIVISFLLAGRDTIASALTSLFWLLTNHPDVELAILVEADRVIGPSHSQSSTSFEQMRELHYLQGAIYESMRLYPPIQFDSKFCEKDDFLPDGSFVKSGTRVTYHPYAMGRVEEIWGSDCLEFKPERWLSKDRIFIPENQFKYPVFQGGHRVCLGKEMALLEIKCVTLSLLRNFHIQLAIPNHHQKPKFSPGLTAIFNGGLPVLVRERDHHQTLYSRP